MDETQSHWNRVYTGRDLSTVSWAETKPESSLELITGVDLALDSPIIDVGGGTSRLAAELVARGYTDVTVADICGEALRRARERDADSVASVRWVTADVRTHDFGRKYALWHDRAVFHFMVTDADRDAYVQTLHRTLRTGGYLVIATFGPEGPTRCSGLPTTRYDADGLLAVLGSSFALDRSFVVDHTTPSGAGQQFHYARFIHDLP